jgi:cytochrome P450
MTAYDTARERLVYRFDRHAPGYRDHFGETTRDMQAKCPVAWSDTYDGHWVASGYQELFDIARRADVLSSDHDPKGERRGYKGVTLPESSQMRSGFIEMDPPEQRMWRQALNPYLSPAAVARWKPFVNEITRAAIDERIEEGTIDFVDHLANIVPAVLTLAMMGLPLADWEVYCEPTHALVYTPAESPERQQVIEMMIDVFRHIHIAIAAGRKTSRPGLIDALVNAEIMGQKPTDEEISGAMLLLIGGGFDTTTALTAHALEYLGDHPDQRQRLNSQRAELLDSATEEFLRFYTPAPGNARTFSQDCVINGTEFREGERIWLSWAMANRDPGVFPDPDTLDFARAGNRHASFGLGVHRCIGSNVARMVFKSMLTAVLDRMPGYVIDPGQTVHYRTIGVIQGMRHLAAAFTPGKRLGPGLAETLEILQRACDEQRLAEPVTVRRQSAAL